MSAISELIGSEVMNGSKQVLSTDIALSGKKVVGLYFSAHWCPPCRHFTPILAKFHKEHSDSKKFEIIFISSDQTEDQFNSYFSEMPWLSVPYKYRDIKDKVSQIFGVKGIPSLILVDIETGDVLCTDGRSKLSSDLSGSAFPWA